MIKITANNNLCVATASPAELNKIKYLLSYPDKSRSFAHKKVTGQYKEFRKYLVWVDSNDNFIFPTGLLDNVKDNFKEVTVIDQRKEPTEKYHFRKYGGPTLRDYQEKCVKNCLEKHRGILAASTGSGKSVIGAELIYRLEVPTLVIVPTLNILKQFYDRLVEMFSEREVGKVGGGKLQIDKNIVISTFQSLMKVQPKYFQRFKALIIDEAHHASADTIQQINQSRLGSMYYRFYMSATPFRADGSDIALEGVVGSKRVFTYNFKEGEKSKTLVKPKFIVFDYHHETIQFKRSDFQKEYTLLVAQNEKYNTFVADVVKDLQTKKRQIMVFVKFISQGEMLLKQIPGAVLITGMEKQIESEKILNDFREKKFNVLIGTSVIGEGVDIPSADCGVLAGGGKSKGIVIQQIGRLLRPYEGKKDAWIIDFSHGNARFSANHARCRQKIFRETYPNTKLYFL